MFQLVTGKLTNKRTQCQLYLPIQALVGNLYDFSIYDFALNPEEVMNLHLDGSCARQPVLMLSKDNTMVYGKPKFTSCEFPECKVHVKFNTLFSVGRVW